MQKKAYTDIKENCNVSGTKNVIKDYRRASHNGFFIAHVLLQA